MHLTGITKLICNLEQLSALRQAEGSSRVFGLLGAAKAAVSAALAADVHGPVLLVTAHPQTALELLPDLGNWTDKTVALYPAIESLPYERIPLDRTLLAQRERVLRDVQEGFDGIVVAPIRALLQPVRDGREQTVPPIELRVGGRIVVDALLATLVEMGFANVGTVEEQGTFARRGGVMDVFPAGATNPVRIELFGNEVESLRAFDPATQRSLGPIDALQINQIAALDDDTRFAALEQLMSVDTSSLNAEALTAWNSDLARLDAGAGFEDLSNLAPYLVPHACPLPDNFPSSTTVILDTAQESWQMVDDLWAQAIEVQNGLVESGNLPPNLKAALLSPDVLRGSLEKHRCIEFRPGSALEAGDHDWSGMFSPAKLYAGKLRAFLSDITAHQSQSTIITSYQHERVAELLAEENLPVVRRDSLHDRPHGGVTLLPVSLSEGWVLPTSKVIVLTDHELFGRPRSRPVLRPRRPARDAFFADFSPGDYVVHMEHGIGRFDAVTRMKIEGVEREYAVVQYAGADRVYVPTDQLERLTRYIRVGESAPQLNKLGGGEWQRARARAKAAAADIARDLIDVYSKRMARPAYAFAPDTPWQHELESSFPYPETPDQLRAVGEVKEDMEAPRPMDRLVCADVGYGKTEVAVRAAFKAIMDGKQVAVLVPTTILAQQHLETFIERFAAFPVKVEALSRFRTPAEQRDILRRTATGEIDILIGTHRLLQKDVSFKNLGLLIVDEEQRFGVKHKEQLKRWREAIDVLTLTATPIPRTLHMGLVGIREISVIETPPEGRLPIRTYLQPYDDRLVREAVLRELEREGQVYVVHNKVATIDAMAERVRRLVPEARVVVAHGQMDERYLEQVMLAFAHGEADVLVCSTIIENGLDIPSVNTIVVNNAHRLGLTQLYQLRGRVGRSANQAYAYLLYPLDVRLSHDAMRRMEAVFEAQDLGAGLNIAMKDLEIRGVGNLLGAEQSGTAAAIGFDLYTRLIAEAVEQLRGVEVEEPPAVTVDLPLTMYLPAEYIGNEGERLTLYRRMAAADTVDVLDALVEEMRDRFGTLPQPVENLVRSVRIKLAARAARVTSISLNKEQLVVRCEPRALYDRVSLYRMYGTEAKISTNVLRIPRHLLEPNWLDRIGAILTDMVRLRESIAEPQSARA